MTTRWKDLSNDAQKGIAELSEGLVFSNRFANPDVIASQAERPPERVSFDLLHRYVTSGEVDLSSEQLTSIDGDHRLRDALNYLLDQQSICSFSRLAAASSEDALEREANGFVIAIVESRATPDTVYLQIKVPETSPKIPQILLAKTAQGMLVKRSLPAPIDGMIQVILPRDDDAIEALRDVATEVRLL